MANNGKKSKFNVYNFFNRDKDGKGIKKEPYSPRNLKFFFKLLGQNIGRITSINMFLIIGNFPFLFGLFAMSGYLNNTSTAPSSSLFAPLYGVLLQNKTASPATAALLGVHGVQSAVSVNTPATYIMFALTGLIIFTFGFTNIGTTFVLRNIVKGEPIFMWSDFWSSIRKNWKQGLIIGFLDTLFIGLLAYDIIFFYFNIGPFIFNMMFYFSLFVAVLYFIMRFYIYLLIVTFKLSIPKVLKNALIFSIIGFKRNISAIVGLLFLLFVNYSLFLMFVPIGIIIPFVILFGLGSFICCYAAYPKIKEIMIDPYYNDDSVKEEAIFKDMG